VPASVTPDELRRLCAGVRMISTSLAHPVDKDAAAVALEPMRRLFTRSLVTTRPIRAGEALREEDLAARKPGSGIPASERPRVVGSRLRRTVDAGTLLEEGDLAPPEAG
jgi:N-acetylneuraminate synthase